MTTPRKEGVGIDEDGMGDSAESVGARATPVAVESSNDSDLPRLNHGINAPVGPFLEPKAIGSEHGRPGMLRLGCPTYPSSSHFVERLQVYVTDILDDFVDDWTEAIAEERETAGPFAYFRAIWDRQHLHLVQFFWSEHKATRIAFFETWTRICLEHLSPLANAEKGGLQMDKETLEDNSLIDRDRLLLRAVGVVFVIHLVRSTTLIGHREETWDRARRPLVDIEADLHHALISLPKWISDEKILTGEAYLDLAFIFNDLLGISHEDGSAFRVLAPTSLGARRPLITSHLSTKAFTQRSIRPWGVLKEIKGAGKSYALTKSELARTLLRKRLGLEPEAPDVLERKDSSPFAEEDEAQSSISSQQQPPKKRLRLDMSGVHLTSSHGPQKPKDRAEKELAQSLHRTDEVKRGYLEEGDVVRHLLGKPKGSRNKWKEKGSLPLNTQEAPVSLEEIVGFVQETTGRKIDEAYEAFRRRQKEAREARRGGKKNIQTREQSGSAPPNPDPCPP